MHATAIPLHVSFVRVQTRQIDENIIKHEFVDLFEHLPSQEKGIGFLDMNPISSSCSRYGKPNLANSEYSKIFKQYNHPISIV